MTPWVFSFASPNADGHAGLGELLENKGANLAQMSRMGLDVPPGFTLTTEVCRQYFAHEDLPRAVETALVDAIANLEARTGRSFGDQANPLVVAVRSGSPVSMPGMMDTVLNLGLNEASLPALAARFDNELFAWTTYGRFLAQFADVVLGADPYLFDDVRERFADSIEAPLRLEQWPQAVAAFKQELEESLGKPFPEQAAEQLSLAIRAVFDSWNSERAKAYRAIHKINDNLGTAVTVQEMVFGNLGPDSGAGVVMTRDPNTGDRSMSTVFCARRPTASG